MYWDWTSRPKSAKNRVNPIVHQMTLSNTELGITADNIILPGAAIEGLKPVQVSLMKDCVFQITNNAKIAGELMRSTAASLYELKQNLLNKQWIAFLKSGALPMPEKQVRDLVAAWEGWLRDADVTDGDLVFIGTRAMAKMKQLEPADKKKLIGKIKAGKRVTEKDVDSLKSKVSVLARDVDADNYAEVMKQMKTINTQVITNNNSFRNENIGLNTKIEKLTKENEDLKKQVAELKMKLEEVEDKAKYGVG